jgi:signal transduction histidine kinase
MLRPKTPEIVPKLEKKAHPADTLPAEASQRALVEAENNLRFSLGRYLHDSPQQQLQAALQLLRQQAELLESDPAQAQHQLAATNRQLMALLNQADSELSLLRREMLPADPRSGTLRMSLESYILEDFPHLHPDATFHLAYRLDELAAIYDDPAYEKTRPEAASEKMLISLFIREGLKNAYKHSQARRVEVSGKLVFYNGQPALPEEGKPAPAAGYYLRLAVKDNGCGFEVERLAELARSGRHRSFLDLETRARLLGGFSRLRSATGKGTLWEIYLPIPPAVAQACDPHAA